MWFLMSLQLFLNLLLLLLQMLFHEHQRLLQSLKICWHLVCHLVIIHFKPHWPLAVSLQSQRTSPPLPLLGLLRGQHLFFLLPVNVLDNDLGPEMGHWPVGLDHSEAGIVLRECNEKKIGRCNGNDATVTVMLHWKLCHHILFSESVSNDFYGVGVKNTIKCWNPQEIGNPDKVQQIVHGGGLRPETIRRGKRDLNLRIVSLIQDMGQLMKKQWWYLNLKIFLCFFESLRIQQRGTPSALNKISTIQQYHLHWEDYSMEYSRNGWQQIIANILG